MRLSLSATQGRIPAGGNDGDTVILQVMTGNHWMDVQQRTLDHGRQAGFTVRPGGPGGGPGRGYRVVLMPTAAHGLSVSNTVTLPSA